MRITTKTAKRTVPVLLVATLLAATVTPVTTWASGADGGDFSCKITGVPAWGHVTSKYTHPDKRHYATAKGTGLETKWANAGDTAEAKTGRAASGNKCWYGF